MIAIQYRLAPEHTFPAAHDDAERGANIVYQYAEQLGIDRERITLAGDSAGGHGIGQRATPEIHRPLVSGEAAVDLPDA